MRSEVSSQPIELVQILRAQTCLKEAEAKSISRDKRISLLLTAARQFYEIAEGVSDNLCKVALIYTAATTIAKVQDLSGPSSNQQVASGEVFEVDSNRFVTNGRLTIASARQEIKGIKEIKKSVKTPAADALNDLLLLEKKLSEIGLVKGVSKELLQQKSQMSALGESFLLLSSNDIQRFRFDKSPPNRFTPSFRQPNSTLQHNAPFGKSKSASDPTDVGKVEASPYGNASKSPRDAVGSNKYLLGVNWGALQATVVAKVASAASTAATTAVAALSGSTTDHDDLGSGQHGPNGKLSGKPLLHTTPTIENKIAAAMDEPDWMSQSITVDNDASIFSLGISNDIHGYSNSVSAMDIRKMFSSASTQRGGVPSEVTSSSTSSNNINRMSGISDGLSNSQFLKLERGTSGGGGDMSEGVVRLLESIKRLDRENQALVKKVDYLSRLEKQNIEIKQQMQEFKSKYENSLLKVKQYLKDFTKEYPHPDNPANLVAGVVSPERGSSAHDVEATRLSMESRDEIGSQPFSPKSTMASGSMAADGGTLTERERLLQSRTNDLERIAKGLLSKLDLAGQAIAKRDKQLQKYETIFKQMQEANQRKKTGHNQLSDAFAPINVSGGSSPKMTNQEPEASSPTCATEERQQPSMSRQSPVSAINLQFPGIKGGKAGPSSTAAARVSKYSGASTFETHLRGNNK